MGVARVSIRRNSTVNQHDQTLERLVKQHARSEPLPLTLSIGGRIIETRQFLRGYSADRREATPAMAAHIASIERPLMCEAALSLL